MNLSNTLGRHILTTALTLCASLTLHAQKVADIEEGYYTLSPVELQAKGYVYSYDTDASRAPYGNAVSPDRPCGRNGEAAYLYCQPSTSVSLVKSAYYFKPQPDGTYMVQSLSGEAYSYLSMAAYDRHLLYHTARPERPFSVREQDYTGATPWPDDEYVVQPFQQAALCDSLACEAHGVGSMIVLDRVDATRITPAMSLRRTLSDARGAMVTYRMGEGPGEVSPLLAYALDQAITQAQAMVDDRNTTQEQADEMKTQLESLTDAYLQAAPTAQNPVTDGYYFIVSAYRAFLLRQNKEKALAAPLTGDTRSLTWRDLSINDGGMAFRLTPEGNDACTLHSYDQTLMMADMRVIYDAEGSWTLARAEAPDAYMTAAHPSSTPTGLYGQNKADTVTFDPQGHLYPGYTASWYLRKAYHQVSIPSSGWAVLGTSFPVEVPDGVEVYAVVRREGGLCLRHCAQAVLPARTAVVLHAARGTYTFPSTVIDAPNLPNNVLQPVCEPLTGAQSGSMRMLKVKNGVAGFARTSATSAAAGLAYVPCLDGEDDFLPLSDEGDGIECAGEQTANDVEAYDLEGRKVNTEGQKVGDIYIINNKKILKR